MDYIACSSGRVVHAGCIDAIPKINVMCKKDRVIFNTDFIFAQN